MATKKQIDEALGVGNLAGAFSLMSEGIEEGDNAASVSKTGDTMTGDLTIQGVVIGQKNNATSMRVKGLQHPDEGTALVQSYSGIFYNTAYAGTGKLKTRVIHGANLEMDLEIQGPHQVRISAVDDTQADGQVFIQSKTDVVFNLRADAEVASPKQFKIDRFDTGSTGAGNTSDINLKSDGSLRIKGGQTDGALIIPMLDDTQRNALTAAAGMFIYNTTDNTIQFYNGTTWKALAEV